MFVEEKREKVPRRVVLEPWRRVLLDAADYIEGHGWCQHEMYNGGKVCALGAIVVASRKFAHNDGGAGRRMVEYLAGPVHLWNDAPSRTQREVTDGLRACATAG